MNIINMDYEWPYMHSTVYADGAIAGNYVSRFSDQQHARDPVVMWLEEHLGRIVMVYALGYGFLAVQPGELYAYSVRLSD